MANTLNQAQQEAVDTINGQLLMVACPGSGKTTTMVYRLANIVAHGVSPNNIIMMTFTKSAAEEMEKRYLTLEGAKKGVVFCTIHSLCLNIIRNTKNNSGILSELEKLEYFQNLLKNSKKVCDDSFIKELTLDIARKKLNPGNNVEILCTNDIKYFEWLYNEYEAYKKKLDVIDFDDMLIMAYNVLKDNEYVLNMYQNRFQYIQVDEYQDVDEVQKKIIYLIAGKNGNLAVCGDDDQSIYAFRGARPEIMLGFKKDYPNAKVVNMGTNYRSAPNIIEKAGLLIQENKRRFDKDFIAAKTKDGDIKHFTCKDRDKEIKDVSRCIRKMIDKGTNPNEIAVLYRNNYQAEDFCFELTKLEVKYRLADGVTSKFEHFIWKDIMTYFTVASEKGKVRDVAQAMRKPNLWLPAPDFNTMPDIDKNGCMKLTSRNEIAFRNEVLKNCSGKEDWQIRSQMKNIGKFFGLIRELSDTTNPATFIKKLRLTYFKYLKDYAEFRQLDIEELCVRYDDYINIAKKFKTWNDLLQYVTAYNIKIKESRKSKEGVTLSTMHKSKGLEWDNVFVVDCVDGICPTDNKKGQTDIEDERRLFYVATTRARENLYLYNYEFDNGKLVFESTFLQPYE